MGLIAAARKVVLENYTMIEGRACRSEYWWFVLFVVVSFVVLVIVDEILFFTILRLGVYLLSPMFLFAMIVPGIAVAVRRLHDLGRSGWWLLIALVPIAGELALIYFLAQPGIRAANKYGRDPLTPREAGMEF